MTRPCHGYCCEQFMLSSVCGSYDTYATYGSLYERYKIAKTIVEEDYNEKDKDILWWFPRIINLGSFWSSCTNQKDDGLINHFSCVEYDRVSGKCKAYADIRTHACRSYPNKKTCEYEGCFIQREDEMDENSVMKSNDCECAAPMEGYAPATKKERLTRCMSKQSDEQSRFQMHVAESNLPEGTKDFIDHVLERRLSPKKAMTLEVKPISNGHILRLFGKETLSSEPFEWAITGTSTKGLLSEIFINIANEFGVDSKSVAEEMLK